MTVEQLINELNTFPKDAEVLDGFTDLLIDKPYLDTIHGQLVVCIVTVP